MNERYLCRGRINKEKWDYNKHETSVFTPTSWIPKEWADSNDWTVGLLQPDNRIWSQAYDFEAKWVFEVDPATLGQCTGLRDKNGKLIFEGDLIQLEDRIVQVIWFKPQATFDLKCVKLLSVTCEKSKWQMAELHIYEVVGNIHDNPSLLEKGA